MRELKQDWRDIFGSFRVAFDVWKLALAFVGVVITCLVVWGLTSIPEEVAGWVIALIVAGVLFVGLVIKFALSDTGFRKSKLLMLGMVLVVLTGAVLLCAFTDAAAVWGYYGGLAFAVLVIWAFFGGAITRIAAVEIASDDRIGLGEAVGFARKKYGAYLGATLLPVVAIICLALSCALFGIVFQIPFVNWIITLLFFVVILAGFLMFLIALGGLAGAPLMYPAVSTEGNDSFDAISRAYSYVFGRPWRYIFYNLAALIYGIACSFFVAFFVKYMLGWSWAAVGYGAGDRFNDAILPQVKSFLAPLSNGVVGIVESVGGWVATWDVTGYVARAFQTAQNHLALEEFQAAGVELGWTEMLASVIIAIYLYIVIGMVVAYILSLFFSMQTTIYLLLRKAVDDADMNQVYREEEEEDYLSVTPEPEPEAAEEAPAEEEKKEEEEEETAEKAPPTKKKAPRKKATGKKKEDKSE